MNPIRYLARLAAEPILLARVDKLTADAQTLTSGNAALRRVNRDLCNQLEAKQRGNETLTRLLDIHKDAGAAKTQRITELEQRIARMEEELLAAHGEVAGLREKLAGWELADTIADETRTKRYMDGLSDV